MSCDFGYNCAHYVPALGKCRELIRVRGTRPELCEQRWLSAKDALSYLGISVDEMICDIAAKKIGVKVQKDGKLSFAVSGAFRFDDCYLNDSTGVCLYFAPHSGVKIASLADRESVAGKHPNLFEPPTEANALLLKDAALSQLSRAETSPGQ